MIGVDPDSEGLKRAAAEGLDASAEGVDWMLARPELPDIVFEATSAYVHVRNAPKYRNAGIRAVDLTPAARGPFVVPPANLLEHIDEMNVNMVTCGGQATIPMVHAVRGSRGRLRGDRGHGLVRSAGPGTRQHRRVHAHDPTAVEVVGGARRARRSSSSTPPTRR
jgi:acetaldehyde dehydrogenase